MSWFLQSLETIFCIMLMAFLWSWVKLYFKLSSDIPTLKSNVILQYLSWISYVYKSKTINYRTYILEGICGLCKMFAHEKIYCVWIFFRPYVVVCKPETAEEVLGSNVLIEKAIEYRFLHPWLSTGLLTSDGEKWRTRRKLLTPSFHFRILEDFISVFNEQSNTLVEKMKQVSHKPWIDIIPLITMCTLDIICNSTMGVCIHAQDNPESEYVKAIKVASEQVISRTAKVWLWFNQIYFLLPSGRNYLKNLRIVHGFTRKVIQEKKKNLIEAKEKEKHLKYPMDEPTYEFQKKKGKAFLELLLELHLNDNSLSEEDIREEVDTFMFEGHDTTAIGICWCLYNIGLYPDVQKKIYEEIQNIFSDDKQRPVTSDDTKAMKYLECVIKESLRLYPSVPIIGRKVSEEVTIGGYKVYPGFELLIVPYMIHRDPETYPNPEAFNPDRFTSESGPHRNPFAYVPFSGGPRNCIGQRFAVMEEKTILSNILRNFKVRSLDPRDQIILLPDVILRPSGPLRIQLIPR